MDGWMDVFKQTEGWLHTKDMAVHVWTGVEFSFAAYELGGYFLLFLCLSFLLPFSYLLSH